MMSASFVPNLAPLLFLGQLQQKVALIRWTKHSVMQLKRQSAEVWRNKKHYSKENTTSQNPIPRREIFKSVDHVKYEGQVRSQHLLFVQFFRCAFKQSCYS